MSTVGSSPLDPSFATLRRFARPRLPAERCELCSGVLATEHPHLLELATRQIVCACDACSTLFDGMQGGKYRRVARRTLVLADFHINDGQWEDLLIPINMAFFFYSSMHGRMVTLYPSPAGAVESLLPLDAWADIVSCATLSQTPLIEGRWLRPGQHLDLVGAFRPDMREADDVALTRAALYVDTRAGALSEAGEFVQTLAAGVIRPGRPRAFRLRTACREHRNVPRRLISWTSSHSSTGISSNRRHG